MNKAVEVERRRKQYLEAKAIAEIAQQSRPAPGAREDELLVKITEKLAQSLKQKYQREDHTTRQTSNVSDGGEESEELVGTHCCGICYEVMLPPERTPMVLAPCGHTFCKRCLQAHRAMSVCPYCRSRVQHVAENQALKSLIQMVHEARSKATDSAPAAADATCAGGKTKDSGAAEDADAVQSKYAEQLELCEFRHKVLSDELVAVRRELEDAQVKKAAVKRSVDHLRAERTRIEDQIEALREQLNLLVSHLEVKLIELSKRGIDMSACS